MAKKNTVSGKSKSKARKNVLERINPNAAGIDIGANFHVVAIPEDRAEENIRKFGPFTSGLEVKLINAAHVKTCPVAKATSLIANGFSSYTLLAY